MENEEKRIGAAEPAGLSSGEVSRRIEQGLVNETKGSAEKTTGQIIKSNLLTYFNLIFLLIAVVLCLVGSFKNLTFLPLVIANSLIGIVQELRAKQILNKMSLLNAPHAVVLRNGVRQKVNAEELVQDDVILLSAGDQICADAEVLQGSVQVNEALLTGEADEIEKTEGASLLSGSFVVSGQCYARLTKVGEESFIAKLTKQAKAVGSGEQSEMVHSINRIVKWAVLPELFPQSGDRSPERRIGGRGGAWHDPRGTLYAHDHRAGAQHHPAGAEKGAAARYAQHRGAGAGRCAVRR